MAANVRYAGAITSNGVPVEGVVTVTTTTTPAGVSAPLSAAGRFSVTVSSTGGDTVTLKVDTGTAFTTTTILGGVADAKRVVDLSCDVGGGSISLPVILADLASARYAQSNALWAVVGELANATNAGLPARSTFEWGTLGQLSDNAAAASGAFLYAAVPMDAGYTITQVIIWVGNTAASTPTHQAAAIYNGLASSPGLLSKGTDTTTAAVAAGAAFTYTIPAYVVQEADVVNGYLYAGFTMTGTAVCTVAGAATAQAANVNIQYETNQPFLAGTSGSALAGVPAATLTLAASTLHQPVIILR